MKSERRHDLQTNYLADHLGTAVQTGKPYAMWFVVGVVALIVLAIVLGLYSAQVAKSRAQAWGDYYFNMSSGDAEAFQQVAEDHPHTAAGQWATQSWADNQLMLGLDQIYANRKQAETTIQSAIEAYQGIVTKTSERELKSRAAMGLAQAYESLGQLDDATRYYQQVASSGQDGFADMATQRLAWIKSGEGKTFYDWFASVKNNPVPSPSFPTDLSKPPLSPDFAFPNKQNPLTLPSAGPAAPTSETNSDGSALPTQTSDPAQPNKTNPPTTTPPESAPAPSPDATPAVDPSADASSADAPAAPGDDNQSEPTADKADADKADAVKADADKAP